MKNSSQHALKSLSRFTAVTFYSTSHICGYECFLHDRVVDFFYFLSPIAKPLFFIIIGYMDEERGMTKKYVLLKIKSVVLIVVFWNILFFFMDSTLFKRGYLLQNEILLSIAIIYLFQPVIGRLLQAFSVTLVAACGLIVFAALLQRSASVQPYFYPLPLSGYFDVMLLVSFYLVGRMLGSAKGQRLTKMNTVALVARVGLVPAALLLLMLERYTTSFMGGDSASWLVAEKMIITLLCLSLFIIFDNLTIQRRFIINTVAFISPTMVGVYIVHYSVFYLISSAYDLNNVTLGFTLMFAVFMASVILSRLLLLNKYTSQLISL